MPAVVAQTPQPIRMPRMGMRVDRTHPILRQCVGWWPLWDGSGGKAVDLMLRNDGSQSGGVTWVDTAKGKAASFDGTDDYFSFNAPITDLYTSQRSMTVCAWVRSAASPQRSDIFSLGRNAVEGYVRLTINETNTAQKNVSFELNPHELASSGYKALSGDVNINNRDWRFIAGVWDYPSTTAYVYVDGKELGSDNTGNPMASTLNFDRAAIGCLRRNANAVFAKAEVKNVRLFSRQLSASEIAQLYTQPWLGLEPVSPFSFYSTGVTPPSGGYGPIFYNHFRNMGWI